MTLRLLVTVIMLSATLHAVAAVNPIEQWRRFEIVLNGPSGGNPFVDVSLSARFYQGSSEFHVTGFYDGDGKYLIRFMPPLPGVWKYTTASSSKKLDKISGQFDCVAAGKGNHGPVKVSNTYDFRYADNTPYYPFGTTLYAWIHQGPALQEQTLQTLAHAPFNKVRMCVFPKFYTYCENEPPFYPYRKAAAVHDTIVSKWDFKQFEPAFFRHLEERIDDLDRQGIEADLIIFHPYDRGHWGFDSMGKENDLRYIKYLVARLSSFKNIWWSMANEFDFIKSKPRPDWDAYSAAVTGSDPYHHLCSIHNGSVYYDNWKPYFTHASIQNGAPVQDFGRANLLRDVYFKPVIYDEVCYEGNIPQRWGRLSGEEMTEAFWQGIIAGTYVTHGETFGKPGDTIFWARGGKLVGSSPARIGFLRKILEDGPGPLKLADEWKDEQTAAYDSSYYMIYFGKKMQNEWLFNLPKKGSAAAGTRYTAEIIDTWNMTVTPVDAIFELGTAVEYRVMDKHLQKIRLPFRAYLAIRLKKLN